MNDETRLERRLDRLIEHAVNPRKAAVVIATVTTAITVLAGWLMTIVDHTGFPTLGSGMWWAVQTVTTVGYGDHVPETDAGQILAAVVMLLGIGFITVITASITGAFVARSRREQHLEGPEPAARRGSPGDHRAARAHRGRARPPALEQSGRRGRAAGQPAPLGDDPVHLEHLGQLRFTFVPCTLARFRMYSAFA